MLATRSAPSRRRTSGASTSASACNGSDALDPELVALFEIIDSTLGGITLSYFESSTVAALLHFARKRVDVAVLEVGMGGRLDASNAVDTDCALVVSVDLDHREWLGDDREAIGREKAGIMRRGKPAVVADRDPPKSVIAYAASEGALPRVIGRDFDFRPLPGGWRRADGDARVLPLPPFGGDEQFGNAAACAAVVDSLANELPVNDDALAAGIRNAYLRGRFERATLDGVEWVFDVAHNPAAAAIFAASLARLPRSAAHARGVRRDARQGSRRRDRAARAVGRYLVRDAGGRRTRRSRRRASRRARRGRRARRSRSRPTSQRRSLRREPLRTTAHA